MKQTILILLAAWALTGCNEKLTKTTATPDLGTLSCNSLDFATIQTTVLTPSCVKCHSWVNSYASVKAKKDGDDGIISRINDGSMPKGSSLTATQKSTILKWLDCGASEQKPTGSTDPGQTAPKPPETTPPVPPTPPVSCESVPDFTTVVDRVITPACLECHKSMNTYAKAQGQAKKIEEQVLTGRMPKDKPPLTAEQKEIILQWVACGTPPANPTTPVPPPTPPQQPGPKPPVDHPPQDPPTMPAPPAQPPVAPPTLVLGPATYENLRAKILEPKCLKCHSSDGHASDYDFTTYKDMSGLTDIFDLQNIDKSLILQDVVAVGKDQMPPEKSKIEHLTVDEIALVREWIRLGLPEK